jgi:hypothetical protein
VVGAVQGERLRQLSVCQRDDVGARYTLLRMYPL